MIYGFGVMCPHLYIYRNEGTTLTGMLITKEAVLELGRRLDTSMSSAVGGLKQL